MSQLEKLQTQIFLNFFDKLRRPVNCRIDELIRTGRIHISIERQIHDQFWGRTFEDEIRKQIWTHLLEKLN